MTPVSGNIRYADIRGVLREGA